jgi:hypothetical protein
VVEYDSIIPPGRVGTITPAVKIKGMHGGTFRKGITVVSNDAKNPTLRLSISGEILPIVGTSPSYVRMRSGTGPADAREVVLRTKKEDLKVQEISFATRGQRTGPAWQESLPFFIEHKTVRDDSTDEKGYYTYHVTMTLKTDPEENRPGEFIIKTNHPERAEIKVRGMLEPGD